MQESHSACGALKYPSGKADLIDAAVKLAAEKRGFAALGLREVCREAQLTPNTLYRHFSCFDELCFAALERTICVWRPKLKAFRRAAAADALARVPFGPDEEEWEKSLIRASIVVRMTMESFFDYVAEKPQSFVIGMSVSTGPSPEQRRRLREEIEQMAIDLYRDIRLFNLIPAVSDAGVGEIAANIIRQHLPLSAEYLDMPERREEVKAAGIREMIRLAAGVIAIEITDSERLMSLIDVARSDGLYTHARMARLSEDSRTAPVDRIIAA
ncbi:TetR family transcriptional regulator [Rhodomicrobium sp. Az07]|uniref:TetR/AcrR family transcriptional regulator n=1 Tax=Rhodomicrobium sp. Az07 TaxID=2839034 RepID=UPI001BEB2837|nr:TetR/AcrR family transcriptional regulator [Rhodomicrobium sp. Az07]MBT3070795.1 TetR family transcriptional regulator [Rhodomicrobium sp. Az07]